MEKKPRIEQQKVEDFVRYAHSDLAKVQALLADEPALIHAAWDWGGGDWETGLGAAAHVGRKDIANHLIAQGARIDIFAAAMLGQTAVVRAILQAYPAMKNARGPHGIPLIVHAKAGGEDAQEVLKLLTAG